MNRLILALFLAALFAAAAFAQSVTVQPSVSVIGEADIQVAPNQVVFTFEVVTVDAKLGVAKRANDTAAAKTIGVIKSYGVAEEDLQTASLTVSPRTAGEKDPRGRGTIIGYEVTKRFLVTFKQLERIDEFLSKAIDAGVNRIVSIDIGNNDIAKHQQQVRLLAIDNARSKAEAYAARLGQKIGRAYVIREESADGPGYTTVTATGYGRGSAGDLDDSPAAKLYAPDAYSQQITFALGKISVEDKIYVTFELKP